MLQSTMATTDREPGSLEFDMLSGCRSAREEYVSYVPWTIVLYRGHRRMMLISRTANM